MAGEGHMPDLRTFIVELSIMLLLGLLLAALGPFGTFMLGALPERLAYWVSLTVGGYLMFRPTTAFAAATAERLQLPQAPAWIAATAIGALPMSFIVWAASYRHRPSGWPSVEVWFDLYGKVLLIGAVISLVFWFRSPRRQTVAGRAAATGDEAPFEPRFLDRLPLHLGRDLLALEMEDHYVRAHTAAGSTLILMRMRDAVAELDGIEGLQVHRSWWVARAAVEQVAQEGRNYVLRLRGGLAAPVARNSVPALRTAGWLTGRAL
jgi:hypothetical protein